MKAESKVRVNLSGKEAWVLSDFYEMCNGGVFTDIDFEDIWELLEEIHDNFNNRKNTFEVMMTTVEGLDSVIVDIEDK